MGQAGFRSAPPELALLAACALWPRGSARNEAIGDAAPDIDWPAFLRVVRRHRMACLAQDGLKAAGVVLPKAEGEALAALARQDCRRALLLVGEASRIVAWLAAAHIDAAIIKGPPLAVLAYGDLAMRHCGDVDILVAAVDMPAAVALLIGRDYRLEQALDVSTPERLDAWLRVKKDVALRNPATGALIELHCRLTDNRHLIGEADVASAIRPVIVGGVSLPSLAGDALLSYLCVHGSFHAWARLKWLADIQALLSGEDCGRLDALYGQARASGLHVPIGVAFLLCAHLFGTELSPALRATLQGSRRVTLLARIALDILCDPRDGADRWRFAQMHASRLLLRTGPRYQMQEIVRRLVDWPTADRLGGGRLSVGLSTIARPFTWARRRLWAKRGDPG